MTQIEHDAYPPAEHVLRDLRVEWEHTDEGTSTAWLPIDDAVRAPSGALLAGVLATLVDLVGGGLAARNVAPDWIATADLTLHLLHRPVSDAVTATGRVLHSGRTTAVVEVGLESGGVAIGVATMSFARLSRRDDNPVVPGPGESGARTTMALPGSGFSVGLLERIELVVVNAPTGVVDVPLTAYIGNSLGAVQGGIIATAIAAAADASLGAASSAPVETIDLQITYLALLREGPLRTRARVLTLDRALGCAHVEVLDATRQVTTVATAVAAPLTRPR